MGVNIFVIAKTELIDTEDKAEELCNKVNEKFGYDDPDAESPIGHFEWCDLFRGEEGWLFSIADALKFKKDSGPWFVITPEMELYKTHLEEQDPILWHHLMEKHGSQEHSVLFLKARG